MRILIIAAALAGFACAGALAGDFAQPASLPVLSSGVYRLPYADNTQLSVFDDAGSHRPSGAVDLVGEPRTTGTVHRIVAAADGVVMAIRDSHTERQSGRAAALCRNNYVWLAHPNGEWTLYSHMRQGSSSDKARLKAGDEVKAGQYLGDEADVGCAMLSHLHFEVAVPVKEKPIDEQGFITNNEGRERTRIPRFCAVKGEQVRKGALYTARNCPE
jgi:murein DD-endopeptidase MepM/ murein hydrolase activator NlpD